jgi:SHS2 domain-containing protein
MPYKYLENASVADVAFEASENTLNELFSTAAHALMNIMIERLETIEKKQELLVTLENDSMEMLLFNYLQEFVFYKDAKQLLLLPSKVRIEYKNNQYYLISTLYGENIDYSRHDLLTDIKAVTLYRFTLEKRETHWYAFVLLDV